MELMTERESDRSTGWWLMGQMFEIVSRGCEDHETCQRLRADSRLQKMDYQEMTDFYTTPYAMCRFSLIQFSVVMTLQAPLCFWKLCLMD